MGMTAIVGTTFVVTVTHILRHTYHASMMVMRYKRQTQQSHH